MTDLDRLDALAAAATPGPWWATTEGSYDQKHAAAKAYEAVMARRGEDGVAIEYSDLSWVRTEGDDWLNVALIGNGAKGPNNAAFIVALVNAYPELAKAVRERDELRAAAQEFLDTRDAWINTRLTSDTAYRTTLERELLDDEKALRAALHHKDGADE